MKIMFFTKGDGPEVRDSQDLIDRIQAIKDIEVETVDTETKDGAAISETYDVFATPSFVVVRDDGSVIDSWLGKVPAQFEIERAINS